MSPPLRAIVLAVIAAVFSQSALDASEQSFKKVVFERAKEKTLELKGEIKYEYKLSLSPTLTQPACRAEVSISYVPMYDKVRVETTVENADCAASSGDYRLQVRTRGHDGEVLTEELNESWRRADALRVETTKAYPLDIDRELVWVRVRTSRKTNCRCDGTDAEVAPADPP